MADKRMALRAGDRVRVAAREFGRAWAQETYGSNWKTASLEGQLVRNVGDGRWKVQFDDYPDQQDICHRDSLEFVSRPAPAPGSLAVLAAAGVAAGGLAAGAGAGVAHGGGGGAGGGAGAAMDLE